MAVWKFCWCYYQSSQNCSYLPTVGGPTKFALLRSSQGCSHCGVAVDWWSGSFSASLRLYWGSSMWLLPELLSPSHVGTDSLSLHSSHHVRAAKTPALNSCHHVTAIFLAIACLFCNSCQHVTAIFLARFSKKTPASGWGSLYESSSFVPWFVLNAFRDITGVVPDLPWISGFMRKSSFTWVKWVGNVSLYRNYPHTTQGIHMYSVVYPESVFGKFSGMVPEMFRNPILVDFPEWFWNGSGNVP